MSVQKFYANLKDGSTWRYVHGEASDVELLDNNFLVTKSVPAGKYLSTKKASKVWGDTPADQMLLVEDLRTYLEIVEFSFENVLSAGPMHMMCSRKLIRANNGVGIVSEDGLSFFWESKNRFNVLSIPSEEILSLSGSERILEVELVVGNSVLRRSAKTEMLVNQKFKFQPAITSNTQTNAIAFTNFLTYTAWLDPYLN
jgi:hypothetical protein